MKGVCDEGECSTICCSYPGSRYGVNIACWGLPRLLAACRRTLVFLGCDVSYRDQISAAGYDRQFSTRCRDVKLPGPGRLPSICTRYPGLRSNIGRQVRPRHRSSYDRWRLSPSRRIRLEFLAATIEAGSVFPRLLLSS